MHPHITKNCSFRRTLKHIYKDALRVGKPEAHNLVAKSLAEYGLGGNFYDLVYSLKYNVKGRLYYRLGKAALRNKKLVSLSVITGCAIHHRDLREISFNYE